MEPEIKVVNVAEGEVVAFPLLLLECQFDCPWDLPENVLAEVQMGETATYWPVAQSGRFKALVHLPSVGAHDIVLNVAECYQFLSVTYAPRETNHKVRVYYQKCAGADGSFDAPAGADNTEAAAVSKLKFNALLLQTAMAELLRAHGFPRETFTLELDDDGQPIVHVVETRFTNEEAWAANDQALYALVAKDIEALGYDQSTEGVQWKHAVLLSCSGLDPATHKSRGHLALGGGKFAQFGAGGLHSWASHVGELSSRLLDATPVDTTRCFDDSCGRGTHWANYATGLGAFFHELGHTLGLGHATHGIMARGFDDMNRLFSVFVPSTPGAAFTHAYADGKLMVDHRRLMEVTDVGGAVWHRADALKLRLSPWIAPRPAPGAVGAPTVTWRWDLLGPLGEGTHDGPQTPFGSSAPDGDTAGFLLTSASYVDNIELLNTSALNDLLLAGLAVGGSTDLFMLLDGEYLLRVDVYAVAWVDGLRFHTNLRTTRVFGGGKGIAPRSLLAPPGHYLASLFGSHGKHHVGKVGAVVRRLPAHVTLAPLPLPAPAPTAATFFASAVSSLFGPTVQTLPAVGDGACDGEQDPFVFKDGLGAVVVACGEVVTNFKCLSAAETAARFAAGYFCAPDEHVFALVPGELLVQVDVRAGAWIDAVRFVTTKRVSPWFGGDGGTETSFVCPPNTAIVGFHGSSGDNYLGTLGVYYAAAPLPVPVPTPPVAESPAPAVTGLLGVVIVTTPLCVHSFATMEAYAALAAEHPEHVVFLLRDDERLVQVDVCRPDGVTVVGVGLHTARRASAWYGVFDAPSLAYLSAPDAHLSFLRVDGADVSYEFAADAPAANHAFDAASVVAVDAGEVNARLVAPTGLACAVVCRQNRGDPLADVALEWASVALDPSPPRTWFVSHALLRQVLGDVDVATLGLQVVDVTGAVAYAPCEPFHRP
ncbi:hypothetical protein ACHHYP_01149 [Achlya hypogyna]|uniref:Jacalin-type lectin domain-containing protein n=1 Tax=Achlya hypogyna TaxID=1202772 RepID=A0A1V9Z9K9_ACHHY|nr:hypothetical protein ACHHYP_01149 [Achlya hypogyna]